MKNSLRNFTQDEVLTAFYISGSFIFMIVALANSYTNYVVWERMILSAKVSGVASNIFNYVLSVFFFFLLRGLKAKDVEHIKEEDIDQMFQELEEEKKK